MKATLYMAISVNGMVAKTDDDTDWISKEEWDSYSATVRKAGCVIVGRRTYHILTKQDGFAEFDGVRMVVVSHSDVELVQSNHSVAHSPQEALEQLKEFPEVIVAGGGILNAAFMEANLVDELVLDIEPIVLGKGIPLFNGSAFDRKLKFIGQTMISKNEIQTRYIISK